jgi:hypothetical protein
MLFKKQQKLISIKPAFLRALLFKVNLSSLLEEATIFFLIKTLFAISRLGRTLQNI